MAGTPPVNARLCAWRKKRKLMWSEEQVPEATNTVRRPLIA
jgi:hypothetical protein